MTSTTFPMALLMFLCWVAYIDQRTAFHVHAFQPRWQLAVTDINKVHQHRTRLHSTMKSIDTVRADEERVNEEITLIPLSESPILLISSQPLLNLTECDTLRKHFQEGPSAVGQALLERVQEQIDLLTNCPFHSGEPALPRCISYPPQPSDNAKLLPDGLHVDTNNGKLFRHVTCLLYLTLNENGATTFPLARRFEESSGDAQLQQAAQQLLDIHIHHTKCEMNQARILEQAAQDLYHDEKESRCGIRVLPSPGMLCVFCNVLENGRPDPLSFHGGESGNEGEKVLLTFFKEIAVDTFASQAEFGERVAETRRYMLAKYYTKS